jgi:hypothetical protein
MRRKTALYRRVANMRTAGDAEVDRILKELAEQCECAAAEREQQSQADSPFQIAA